jgi:nucleoside-diphosphate-sugar epimerase
MKKTVLLTGATGFIGSLLAEELVERGFYVKALVRNPNRLRWPIDKLGKNLEIVKGDITKIHGLESAAKDVKYIIHTAGLTKAVNYENYYLANAKSCEFLINARDKKKFKQFIFFSSAAAGGPASALPKKESDAENPLSNYGITKLKGEQIVKSAGINYTIFRPVPVYGERDVEFLPLFKVINKGFKLILGTGKKITSMIYVKDLIKGIILSIDNKKAFNKTYNIADGKEYNWIDINNAAEKAAGKKCRTIKLPEFSAKVLGNVNSVIERIIKKPMLLNKEKLKEMQQQSWAVDTTLIENDLGFKPDYSLEQGFVNTYHWYTQNGWINKKR